MKSKIPRRSEAAPVRGQRRERGVAILTVLAVISLMTVLVISFFNMAQTQQTTAKGAVEVQRVATLRDTVLNLVIAQIREATTLEGSNADQMVVWSSQPGAIRTYSGVDTSRNILYKLYSSDQPQVTNIQPYDTESVLRAITKDLVSDWNIRIDEFVDINRPVYTVASGSRAIDPRLNLDHFTYPIVDPRRYNGMDDPLNNTEGFSYSDEVRGMTIQGVNPKNQQLAMPVRWIYVLQDGTMGYIPGGGEFTPLTGGTSTASRDNPIVGRMAWWTDDESCKVNINTASVPSVWDTPRTTSREDREILAGRQPLAGEFQRCPGHPATTDISAVLFPGKRFTPDPQIIPPGGNMRPMSEEEAQLIWTLAPYIKDNDGTNGGLNDRPGNKGAVAFDNDDYIYTSFDEMYFRAAGSDQGDKNLNNPRPTLLNSFDKSGEFLTRLEQSQFFLTHKSHSPEVTMHGFPRISMYPMNSKARNYVGTNTTPPSDVSPYDVALAVNSTIGKQAYFTQREDPNSRHGEFYNNAQGRNRQVFKYLKELSRLPIPGYPEIQPIKINNSQHDDPTGLALASKYPAPYNNQAPGTQPFKDTTYKSSDGLLLDASDRTQILWSMLDYTRSINMNAATLTTKYNDGKGQATAFCGCATDNRDVSTDHTSLMSSKGNFPNMRVPKGFGRAPGIAEVAMIVNVAASRTGTQQTGDARTANNLDDDSRALWNSQEVKGRKFLVEVGFVVNTFCPKLGWTPVFPRGGIAVSTGEEPGGQDPRSPANKTLAQLRARQELQLPFSVSTNGKVIPLGVWGAHRSSYSNNQAAINDLLPMGGMQGPRPLLNNSSNIAMCRPFVVMEPETAGDTARINLQTDSSGVKKLRIHLYDDAESNWNVTQQIELAVPADMTQSLSVPMSGQSLANPTFVRTFFQNATLPGTVMVKSWVVPHGDYRHSVGPLRVEKDVFVPHGNYRGGSHAYSFWEPNLDINKRKYATATYGPGAAMILDPERLPALPADDIMAGRGPILPPQYADTAQMTALQALTNLDPKVAESATTSTNALRRLIFQHGRLDGHGISPNRGSSDPTETGDFDQGVADAPDGPYLNATDDGDVRIGGTKGYFGNTSELTKAATKYAAPTISPNFLIRSPVDFGSIPTGIQARVPWQTLRFRPDPGMNRRDLMMTNVNDAPPRGMPFANYCGPRDHFFLDMFWMPVVEPWSISEPFSTKGTINLNQQIYPFMYIKRTTALHALLRGERMLAIHNDAAAKYKSPTNNDNTYRYFINARETVRQFEKRYEGFDAEDQPMPFNAFRSASEICEMWLVPDKNGGPYEAGPPWTLEYMYGNYNPNTGQWTSFWAEHRLTGDNSRERPYANLYPRVTTRSNVFKVHLVVQSLQKGISTNQAQFDSTKDAVTGEWRGSAMIERSIDPRDSELSRLDYVKNLRAQNISDTLTPRIDRYYIYRVTEVKQLTE